MGASSSLSLETEDTNPASPETGAVTVKRMRVYENRRKAEGDSAKVSHFSRVVSDPLTSWNLRFYICDGGPACRPHSTVVTIKGRAQCLVDGLHLPQLRLTQPRHQEACGGYMK